MRRLAFVLVMALSSAASADTLIDQWRKCVLSQYLVQIDKLQSMKDAVSPISPSLEVEIAFNACLTEEQTIRAILKNDLVVAEMKMRIKRFILLGR